MAITVIIFLTIVFLLGLFSLLARRFSSSSPSQDVVVIHRRSPPPLLLDSGTNNFRRHGLRHLRGPAAAVPGLDPVTIHALPVLTYLDNDQIVGGCVVCLSEFVKEERLKLIPGCGHVFHPGCIDGWLVLHGSCPVCRCSEMVPGEVRVDVDNDSGGAQEEDEEVATRELGRSKSFGCEIGGGRGSGAGSLRRVCSF